MRQDKQLRSWNFGLRAKAPLKAMEFAVKEREAAGAKSFATVANTRVAQRAFADHLKEMKIKDLRKVDVSTLQAFADKLRDRVERGEICWRTATEYMSRVNATLEAVRYDRDVRLSAKDAGFPSRDGIARQSHAAELPAVAMSEQTKAILGLERAFGLRSKEAVLLDARSVIERVGVGGAFVLERGTKGGRPREIEVRTAAQLEALREAARVQAGKYSQIPDDKRYIEFRTALYAEVVRLGIRQHGLRHAYAHELYEELTGVKPPVVAGIEHKAHRAYIAAQLGVSLAQARDIDNRARLQVARELGHGRKEISNSYLG